MNLKVTRQLVLLGTIFWCSFLLFSPAAKATHSQGADLTFACLGPNQYRITLKFFRDCSGVLPLSSYVMTYSSASCGVNSSITLSQQGAPVDITPICPSGQTSCNGGGGSFGTEQWTFSGILNLPAGCGNDWVLSWSECCRNNAITTLSSPGSQSMVVNASLNNTVTPCNSSPVFNNIPTPVVCVNQPVNYNHGVTDPNNDSLVFSLVNCLQSTSGSVTYAGGFSGVNPLTSGGVSINSQTGQLTFTPTAIQIGVICVRVQEYRNGVLISTVVRDMQFRVINCTNTPPVALGMNGTNDRDTTICVGSTLCFTVPGSDANGNNVSMVWNTGIVGGIFSVGSNNTPTPTGNFCWTPTSGDLGPHFFTVTVTDNACLISGTNTYTFLVNVVGTAQTLNAGPDVSICAGSSTVLSATSSGATGFTWTPSGTLSNPNISNPTATPPTTTTYTVVGTFPDGCRLSDNVNVTVNQPPTVAITPSTVYTCSGVPVTLTATSPTATGYQWSTGATTSSINFGTASTTTVSVTATDVNGCQAVASVQVIINAPTSQACNIIYATPTGVGNGTRTSPANLVSALNLAACNNTVIKLATGTYTLSNPVTNMTSFVTLEGGFNPVTWEKTSTPGATTITRNTSNLEGPASARRLTAFSINGQSNFRFQDLTISVSNAPTTAAQGVSTYGVYMVGCSNYNFVRVTILGGNASPGASGTAGTVGANGSVGGGGTAGANDSEGSEGIGGNGGTGAGGTGAGTGGSLPGCCSVGATGGAGSAGVGRNGGGGGGGASGGQEQRVGGVGGAGGLGSGGAAGGTGGVAGTATGCDGNNGGNGSGGVNGAAGAAGAAGPAGSHAGGFWVPGLQGGTGNNGSGGGGGAGGGGGGGQGGGCGFVCTCIDGAGSGGGGGGGGGQGGTGGTGGWGGGGAFCVYLQANGANGRFDDCRLVAGSLGGGGTAGAGGGGGTGGAGGAGNTYTGGGEVGAGGNGGTGGSGGAGGAGGAGATGVGQQVFTNGTALALTDINFNLPAQPTILMENISCTNTDIDYSSAVSALWNLGTGSSPTTPTGALVTTQYSSLGRKNIVYSGNTYTGFANIILGDTVLPHAGTNAPFLAGNYRVCAGSSVGFFTQNPGSNYIYHWTMGGGSTPNSYSGTAFANVNGAVFNTPGTYNIILRFETDCCGLSQPDTIVLIVDPQPNLNIVGPNAFCANDPNGVVLTASGGTSYLWSPPTGLNTTTGPQVVAIPGTTTAYSVVTYNAFGNCSDNANVLVTVNQLNLAPSSVAQTCGPNGSATITPSGGSGSYSYIWGTGQTTPTVTPLVAGTYGVTVTDNVTGCQETAFVTVATAPGTLAGFISNVTPVSCNGGTDGLATVTVTGGVGPFQYTWAPVGGSGSTTTPVAGATYAVSVLDQGTGCATVVPVTIPEPSPVLGTVLSSDSASCPAADGQATVNASGGTGPYTYSWSNGASGATQTNLSGGIYSVTATDSRGCQTVIPVTVDCLLPVEYSAFSARGNGDHILLAWETGMESNNRGFHVMRSDDGVSFTDIGWVDAAANPDAGAAYQYPDRTAVPGILYHYRLRQEDYNGATSYSELREAMLPISANLTVNGVFPNPIDEQINVDVTITEAMTLRLQVTNILGQNMPHGRTWELKPGRHTLTLGLSDLASGLYFAKLSNGAEGLGTVKFIKAN